MKYLIQCLVIFMKIKKKKNFDYGIPEKNNNNS